MKITKSGLIIKTNKAAECIHFYKEILKLQTLFESSFLTCFGISGNYLMIEPNPSSANEINHELLVLRMNVDNVVAERDYLISKGVESFYNKFEWGEILTFFDPAGTRIELKDSIQFEKQIQQKQQQQ